MTTKAIMLAQAVAVIPAKAGTYTPPVPQAPSPHARAPAHRPRLSPGRRLGVVLALGLLSACDLAPVYSGGSSGPTAQLLAGVEVAPIPDKAGFLVRDRLTQRLGVHQGMGDGGRFRLQVALDDRIDGFGVRGDNSIIRERRTLRARWQLVDIASEKVLLDATAGSDSGIDVVGSEYATVAAEATQLERLSEIVADQIVARLALYARDGR